MLNKRKKKEKKKALTFAVETCYVYTCKVLANQLTCDLQIASKVSHCGEKSEDFSIFSAFTLLSELNSTRNTVALLRDISIRVCDHKKMSKSKHATRQTNFVPVRC